MRTSELIGVLAHDGVPGWNFRTRFLGAVVCSMLLVAVLFFSAIGVRPDFDQATGTVRFLLKFVIVIPLAAGAMGLARNVACPGSKPGAWRWPLLAAPLILLCGVAAELWLMPVGTWAARMIGHNSRFCLTLIPLMSIAPMACLLTVLRQGAPANPGLAGAAAGLASAALAAVFYAANCDDDSPLFVLLWYPLAIGFVTSVGYGLGRRFLRW